MTDFTSLNLAPPLASALTKLGYTTPTPIQAQAIPQLLKGRDLMGIAQTGTGKTAAFALPILHHICEDECDPPKRGARVLVLAPTRELADQIAVSFRDYGRDIHHLAIATVFGGVSIQRQIKRLVGGNDVLVATPGRLIDLLDRKAITLKDIEILVLDEADQMMDMGFIHALKKIIPLLPKKRQTLFFSATMVPKIKALAGQFLTDPVTVSVTPANSTAENVEQRVTFVDKSEKQSLLALSLLEEDVERALVFTRTKHGADRVVKRLAQVGLDSVAIHGNKSQGQRQRALAAFREARIKFLIATDVAARGIDIEGITHVFNFEIPNVPEQYVHRIGRTARANRSGIAHAFVDKEERGYLKDIQRLLKTQIPVISLPEDFLQKSQALKKRPALVKAPEPKSEPRKGRGKSRKKARFSKDKARKSSKPATPKTDNPSQSAPSKNEGEYRRRKTPSQNAQKPKRDAKPKSDAQTFTPASGESRAQRKAKNQARHAAQHSQKSRPKKNRPKKSGPNPDARSESRSDSRPSSKSGPKKAKPKSSGPKSPQRFGRKHGHRGKR